jgi:hypothetical protein
MAVIRHNSLWECKPRPRSGPSGDGVTQGWGRSSLERAGPDFIMLASPREYAYLLNKRGCDQISRGIAAGRSMQRIAQGLGRSPSTISREIRRNGGCSAYRASWADRRAWERALRPKPCRLARHAELRWRVAQKLVLQWSTKPTPLSCSGRRAMRIRAAPSRSEWERRHRLAAWRSCRTSSCCRARSE